VVRRHTDANASYSILPLSNETDEPRSAATVVEAGPSAMIVFCFVTTREHASATPYLSQIPNVLNTCAAIPFLLLSTKHTSHDQSPTQEDHLETSVTHYLLILLNSITLTAASTKPESSLELKCFLKNESRGRRQKKQSENTSQRDATRQTLFVHKYLPLPPM